MHGAGEPAHLHEAEPGAAEPLRDLLARLRERPEQPADLGVAHADAAVGYGKRQAQLAACKRRRRDPQADLAALGELHRIRHQVFDRRAQQRRIAGHMVRQIARDAGFAGEALGLGARGEREREPGGEARQGEGLAAQLQAPGAGPCRLDRERGQLGEMPGRILDGLDPAALALAEPRCRQQFTEGEYPGQRRADVVGESGEHGLDRARGVGRAWPPACGPRPRARISAPRPWSWLRTWSWTWSVGLGRGLGHSSPCPAGRRGAGPDHCGAGPSQRAAQPIPIIARISAGAAPPARSSRSPVAQVDFDSFRPSASRIRR